MGAIISNACPMEWRVSVYITLLKQSANRLKPFPSHTSIKATLK
uniref:Uncharacterized protein n=1 Tax=Schistosoma mansoni TaxID=6183 RepID=A0A5K4F4W5_SCHMA